MCNRYVLVKYSDTSFWLTTENNWENWCSKTLQIKDFLTADWVSNVIHDCLVEYIPEADAKNLFFWLRPTNNLDNSIELFYGSVNVFAEVRHIYESGAAKKKKRKKKKSQHEKDMEVPLEPFDFF